MKYHGSCHCGKVDFEVELDLSGGAISCNCSICSRRGSVLAFAPRENLVVHKGEDELATYTFNKHVIHHRFCKTCGILPFGEATDPKGVKGCAINLRCLDDLDIASVTITKFDGRSM
jgi:hypothetical protein